MEVKTQNPKEATVVAEEAPLDVPEISISDQPKPISDFKPESKPEVDSSIKAERQIEAKPEKNPEIGSQERIRERQAIKIDEKPTVPREEKESLKINLHEEKKSDSKIIDKEEDKTKESDILNSPGGSVRSPTGDYALSPTLSPEESAHVENFSASTADFISPALVEALKSSLKKTEGTDQSDKIKGFKTVDANGNVTWTKTHFIFMIDCSGSMEGARWESVCLAYEICIRKLLPFKDIVVSAFTFDNKVNPFCREKTPNKAPTSAKDMPFTKKGTSYKRPLNYAIRLLERTLHKDYLNCLIFLSDGEGGECKDEVNKIKSMGGTKYVFYSIACETDEEDGMIDMSKELGGEHFKLYKAEAARIIFTHILGI